MGTPYEKQDIEQLKGDYDEDGFYILEDKSFFDPWGYRFNIHEDGYCYDEFGGYYDDYGYYVPGEGHGDYYKEKYDDYNDYVLEFDEEEI